MLVGDFSWVDFRAGITRMKRVFYTLIQAIRQWGALKTYMDFSSPWRVGRLPELSLTWLAEHGIQHLALDFDGVMAPHGDAEPLPEVVAWLQQQAAQFNGHIYILSNKPLPIRIEYFRQHFPRVSFVMAKRKKPYPDGLVQILNTTGAKPEQVCLVDDRLLTGVLATQIAGAKAIYITKPYACFRRRFIQECFFAMLRNIERFLLA